MESEQEMILFDYLSNHEAFLEREVVESEIQVAQSVLKKTKFES